MIWHCFCDIGGFIRGMGSLQGSYLPQNGNRNWQQKKDRVGKEIPEVITGITKNLMAAVMWKTWCSSSAKQWPSTAADLILG